jgi:serine/threonine-protein kinase
MNADRWARVADIYQAALDRLPGERDAYVAGVCGGDDDLRREVESLLAQAEKPVLIDAPVWQAAARVLDDNPAVQPGARIGPYEVGPLIGEGGMGQVYRAHDTTLGRDVALKVLPAAFTNDADRLTRLRREAQVLASLNHPHIAAIYGFEAGPAEAAGAVHALVLELVEGPTLADRLAQGAVPLDEALPIARQIADALETAHARGIVHRDLKPANVKVRADGTVKVLDFGLAKALEAETPSPADASRAAGTAAPPVVSPAITAMGVILGTAAYMAPEQARGKPADQRSDIWAFGCVLYEMLAGQRAFDGDDVADTLAAVLRQDVDWTRLPASTPAPVRRLIARCLDRDVRRRLRDIGEARIVLEDPTAQATENTTGVAAVVPPMPRWRRAIPVVFSAIVASGLASAAALHLRPSPAPPLVTRFPLSVLDGQTIAPRTSNQAVAFSPDGSLIAFTTIEQLYLRRLSELEARPIASAVPNRAVISPAFSPDSRSLVFWSDRALRRVPITGGTPIMICPADQPFGVSWGPAGILFGQAGKGVMRVSEDGGTPEVLVSVHEGEQVYGPQILPDGETVLFSVASGATAERWDKARIVTQSLRSGERKTLVEGGSDGRYLPTGHLVYARGGIVYAVAMDLRRLEVTGEHVPIIEGVRRAAASVTGAAQFDFSSTGSLIYMPGPISGVTSLSELALIDRKGGVVPLKLPPGPYEHPRVSPNGAQLAFAIDDGKEANVWTYELGSTMSMQRLTSGGKNRFPIWSGDGRRIAFQSDREGDLAIFWQRADAPGPGAGRLTRPEPGTAHVPEAWSPIEERLLFGVTRGSRVSLWTLFLPDKKATPFSDEQSPSPPNATFSPDGQLVAYTLTEGEVNRIYVQPFPATGERHLVSTGSAVAPVFSRDGRELVSQPRGGQGAVQAIITKPRFSFSPPTPIPRGGAFTSVTGQRNYDLMPDGRILGVVPAGQTLLAGSTAPQFQVVLNWFEELRRRVPSK